MTSELTETTEYPEASLSHGWIFYDADCRTCRDLALRLDRVFARRGFTFAPLQERWVHQRLHLTPAEALEEMRVLTADDRVFGGADAIIYLAQQIPWAAPLHIIARIPAVRALLQRIYRWVAAHRSCASSQPAAPSLVWRTRWLPLCALPIFALATKPLLPPWGFMWVMAVALFFGCKWLTLGVAIHRQGSVCPLRATAYLFASPGMDAMRFLSSDLAPRTSPSKAEMLLASARIVAGAGLLFELARHAPSPLVAGWMGMTGMILMLHFGFFHLLSIGWRAARVDAAPIMDAPLRSRSLSEFWGRRWNAAFDALAFRFVFRPIVRSTGTVTATFAAFFASGVIHELVISLPAGAGYGLPTAYFLAQALGLVLQRRGCFRGRLCTIAIVAAPAFWLFHPPFVRRVILPFMHAIGAL